MDGLKDCGLIPTQFNDVVSHSHGLVSSSIFSLSAVRKTPVLSMLMPPFPLSLETSLLLCLVS